MPTLRELQGEFVAAMFASAAPGAPVCVGAGGLSPSARLAVYRNAIFHNYGEALRDVYPVIARLVGDDFFRLAGARYIPRHASRHGNLHRYGASFGDYLDGFSPAAGLPYLGDVARLEWRVHESFHAADHAALALDRLRALAPAQLPSLVCTLHPACRLFASRYPVQRIWRANQPGAADETIALDAGGVRLLIHRRDNAVEIELVDAAQFSLLSALADGLPLNRALATTLAASATFDFAAFLRQRIVDATIVDLRPVAP